MRVFTSGVKVVDGLFGSRLCLLAVCVFVSSIDCSNSSDDNVTNATTEEVTRHHPSNLSEIQLNSAFTIEFNFKHIGKTNRTAVIFAYREARRKILNKLNYRRRHNASSPTNSTTVEIVTETPTTVSTTTTTTPPATVIPETQGKRKRRGVEGNKSTLTDDDLPFIDNGLEIDEDEVLRISLSLNTTEISNRELWDALDELETEEDGFKEIAPVIDVYQGLPPVKAATADIRVWLPILFAIIILIIIFIGVYCCWKTRNKKVRDVEYQKTVPKQDSTPTPSIGPALPRILDDNSGWLVPLEQFDSEHK